MAEKGFFGEGKIIEFDQGFIAKVAYKDLRNQ